jgi:hypothetical protein
MSDKRNGRRIPLDIYLNKVLGDDVYLCRTSDLSPDGVFLTKLIEPRFDGREVGLEFELPGTGEVIWAVGQVVRDVERLGRREKVEQGNGIRFTRIPDRYKKLIQAYVARDAHA